MESTVVIKVKYGETLRRFNARVNEAGQLDLNIGGLREKVLGLFNFASHADLALTYIDEDGDVVTLVDDEDLCDVMRQSLNPLRITVKLNAEKGGRPNARSSGNCTPMRSPRVQHILPNLNSSVSETLKSVPEPFREAFTKMSLDLASKASSSSSGLAELVESFAKMGQSYMNLFPEILAGTYSITQSGASGSTMGASMTKEPDASREDGASSKVMPNAKFEETTSKTNQKVDLVNSTGVVDALVNPSLNLNTDLPGDSFLSGSGSESESANLAPVAPHYAGKEEVKKFGEYHLSGKVGNSTRVNLKAVASTAPAIDDDKEVKKSGEGCVSASTGASPCTADAMRHFIMDHMQEDTFPAVAYTPYASHLHPFKRSHSRSDGMGSAFHRGVRCYGCGVHPITGPRFKSKVKVDYDLCSICFSEIGNEAEYIRMDRPVSYQHYVKGLHDPMQHSQLRPPTLPCVLRGGGMKPSRPKLDNRFVMDVNVLDGTIMAPSTPFTKIWRMRNNGTTVWPQGTQLVWIGGDKLSTALSVELEILADGLPVENELDVVVDFTAPELPGRYISYWRMASPSGQKFGQRVWVLIQVDASLKDVCDRFLGLNLNLPPDCSGIMGPESTNVNVEPIMVEGSLPVPEYSDRVTELVDTHSSTFSCNESDLLVDERPTKFQELNFPINDTLLVGGVSNTVPPMVPTPFSYPISDLSEVASAVPSPSTENDDVEQTLLRELEQMGFKQVDLNKEILRLNEYDLEQSLDDLCGVAEWDPILEELQEMGFSDKETNKRLLKKNNGSIKLVVMDLITGEKKAQSKRL